MRITYKAYQMTLGILIAISFCMTCSLWIKPPSGLNRPPNQIESIPNIQKDLSFLEWSQIFNPFDSDIYYEKGILKQALFKKTLNRGTLQEALIDFHRAILLNPGHFQYYLVVVQTLTELYRTPTFTLQMLLKLCDTFDNNILIQEWTLEYGMEQWKKIDRDTEERLIQLLSRSSAYSSYENRKRLFITLINQVESFSPLWPLFSHSGPLEFQWIHWLSYAPFEIPYESLLRLQESSIYEIFENPNDPIKPWIDSQKKIFSSSDFKTYIDSKNCIGKTFNNKIEIKNGKMLCSGVLLVPIHVASHEDQLKILASSDCCQGVGAHCIVQLNQNVLWEGTMTSKIPQSIQVPLALSEGNYVFEIIFINDTIVAKEDRNLYIHSVEIV